MKNSLQLNLFILATILMMFSCSENRPGDTSQDEDQDKGLNIELNVEDDLEEMNAPIYTNINRLNSIDEGNWTTIFWDDFSFEVPFSEYEVLESEKTDHSDKRISKIYNGVIYTVQLSDYGEEMLKDRDFDTGFLYYRHRGLTEGSEIHSEQKFLFGPKKSNAIYSCYTYEMNGKNYFEDLFTVKQDQYIFEMTVTSRPYNENYDLVAKFFDGFLIL